MYLSKLHSEWAEISHNARRQQDVANDVIKRLTQLLGNLKKKLMALKGEVCYRNHLFLSPPFERIYEK